MSVKLDKPRIIYKLVYWSVNKQGDQEDAFGEQDFDMSDHPPGHPMDNTEMSRVYQRLYDDPTIFKVEIWEFFAGFKRRVPGMV